MIITIDGPVATGKSTIARKLASEIGFIYFDTGAMYRCFTYYLLKKNVNIDDRDAVKALLSSFKFDVKAFQGERHYFVEKEDVSEKIRGDVVTKNVSKVSAYPEVREKMVLLQKDMGKGLNAVFEGRDMGTTVFPAADLKIFLTGRTEIRATRRLNELKTRFPEESKDLTIEKVIQEVTERDEYDSNREHSPLKQASDAYVVDTSDLSPDEIVFRILEIKDSAKSRPIK